MITFSHKMWNLISPSFCTHITTPLLFNHHPLCQVVASLLSLALLMLLLHKLATTTVDADDTRIPQDTSGVILTAHKPHEIHRNKQNIILAPTKIVNILIHDHLMFLRERDTFIHLAPLHKICFNMTCKS